MPLAKHHIRKPAHLQMSRRLLSLICSLGGNPLALAAGPAAVIASAEHRFTVETLAEGLEYPWGMAFLPDGRLLVTERPGRLRVIADGVLAAAPLAGVPESAAVGQGGLLDVVLHPEFARNRYVYLSRAVAGDDGYGTEVVRGVLDGLRLTAVETIFRALPKFPGGRHFGSRLLFLPDGTLLITLGDRGYDANGQDLGTHPGSIIRVTDAGKVPPDNPFVDRPGMRPEIYTYGNRNVQGITLDRASGRVWASEHGPQGGDEVNVIEPGTNYGWPVITYGRNYGTGTRIGEGERRADVADPPLQWTPSISTSGLAFYDGAAFPRWQGNLFAGSLKFQFLSRLSLDGRKVVGEERLLGGRYGRIRDVRQGPEGHLYLLTDEPDGALLRLAPAP